MLLGVPGSVVEGLRMPYRVKVEGTGAKKKVVSVTPISSEASPTPPAPRRSDMTALLEAALKQANEEAAQNG